MAGHEPNQKISGDLGNLFQQVCKIHSAVQILAIGIHILPQQGDVLDTAGDQLTALLQNVLGLAAALPAPDVGDNAVGAEVVAAIHDGNPGFQLGIPDLGNAFGDGTRFICDVELPLFLAENLP